MKETIITAALAVFSTVMLVVAGAGILFRDNTPPVLTLEGKNNLTYTEGDTYDDLLENMTAEDDKDGDVTDSIRTQEIGQKASLVSAHQIVRDAMLDMQRDVAKHYNVIMDGRDIGTVVLPKATVKIFLTASPEVRAQRRTKELLEKGQKANFEKVLAEIKQRDYQDTHRDVAPLKMCRDSIKVDTSEMDLEEAVAAMKQIIEKKVGQ